MNCHEAQNHLFAARDSALDSNQRASLDGHVAHCANCRRMRDDLVAAFSVWRKETAEAPVPDVEREWHAVRRRIRGGADAGTTTTLARPRRNFLPWLAVPIGAAAALALALYVGSENGATPPTTAPGAPRTHIARADSVEVPGNASTMVYVDDKSGWLIVWASDSKQI